MRILHSSDWHLGQNFYGKTRRYEHQCFLNWLLTQIKDLQIDALIVAGDLFDTGSPPSYAREMLNQFVVAMQKLDCQLVLLGGNHDSVAMLTESRELFACLNSELIANVQPDLNQQIITLYNQQQEPAVQCCAIPFIRPRDVLTSQANNNSSTNANKTDLLSAIQQHYQALYQLALDKNKQLGLDLPIIGTGHLTVVNASTSDSVRDIYIGNLEAFPASAFPEFDYLALGHIHQAQSIAGKQHWRYSGSPIAMSFDEVNREKSLVLIEFEANQRCRVETISIPCFQPLLCLKGNLAEIEQQLRQMFSNKTDLFAQTEQSNVKTAWLDLEINSSDFHSDVQKQVEQICQQYPVEILLVRRSRNKQQIGFSLDEKLSLDEIDPNQVFQQKLIEQNIESEQAEKLTSLFLQTVEQLQQPELTDNIKADD